VYSIRASFFLLITLMLALSVRSQSSSAACTSSEYHQFDFWVGDWQVLDAGKPVAHVVVDKILGGCVIREHYSEPGGYEGQSLNIYDAGRHYWRQTWVTNRGKFLEIRGTLQGGSMVLSGTDYDSMPPRFVRGTWKPLKDGVEETAITSTDGGKTWTTWFDLFFRPFRKSR
jgi:hypothetical protein